MILVRFQTSVLVPLAAILSGCGGNPWEPRAEAVSPDGHVRAVLEYKGSAACCSDHSRLVLTNRDGGTLLEPGVVVSASRAAGRAPIWISNDLLVVEMCEASEVEVRSQMRREPMTLPDGRTNAIRIEVVTAPNTTWGERVLCHQP